ncbi:MAG: serine/threonine-protein kinase [Mycobacteriales bacterium]
MTVTPAQSNAPVRVPDGFDCLRLIGRGGNGYVVCARQRDLDRLVAIKMIIGGALAAGGIARLQREGRALARLNHRNVVRVYAAVPMGQDLALVLEFVDGLTLEAALETRALTIPATFAVLGDVAAAIEHCAQSGIVHRDLKPANILLDAAGRAKVADFGLSRLSASAAAFRTSSGVVSGTPAYMAPEQILDPDREHPASDSYSFAVIAHRALTGTLPVAPGESPGAPTLPASLHPIATDAFTRALCRDPASRLRPADLLAALRRVPASGWHYAAAGPAVAPEQTAAATAAAVRRADGQAPAHDAAPLEAGGPAASGRSAEWVDVPVFVPAKARRSVAQSPVLVGLVVGVVLVLLVAVLLAGG